MSAPMWVIKMITQPAGFRLPKMQEHFVPQYAYVPPTLWGDRNNTWTSHTNEKIVNGKVNKGNLENGEYEFWAGSVYDGSKMARCRGCGYWACNEQDRRNHFELAGDGCGKRVKDVARLLSRDAKCVICDANTNRRVWGFPLCNKLECIADWKFWHGPSTGFSDALAIVKANERTT